MMMMFRQRMLLIYLFNYLQATEMTGSPADLLSRRCVTILKKALSADVWPNSDLKLAWFDKILITVEGQQPNFNNICTALELLAFLLTILVSIMRICVVQCTYNISCLNVLLSKLMR